MPNKMDINEGVAVCRATVGGLLVDVRNDFEYKQGHIPGAFNLATSRILKEAETELPDKSRPLFLYCRSGARSARAAKLLTLMGYEAVTDIGGIADYQGQQEK